MKIGSIPNSAGHTAWHCLVERVQLQPWEDVLIHAVGKDKDRLTQADRIQVVRCLTHHGWQLKQERRGSNRGKRFYWKAG